MPASPRRGSERLWTVTPNPYDELGVSPDASTEEIRRAYLRAARDSHPDRHAGAGPREQRMAEERMRRINAAWNDLSAPDRRMLIDKQRMTSTTDASGPFVAGTDHPGADHAGADRADDDVDVDVDELNDDGAPLPSGARLATALAPLLLICAAGLVMFGLLFVIPTVIAIGFATGAVAVALFLAAPLLAMGDARRND